MSGTGTAAFGPPPDVNNIDIERDGINIDKQSSEDKNEV
jgi:hypothetical protein